MDRVFDAAIADFYHREMIGPLLINNKYGQPDEMPIEVYFREEENLIGLPESNYFREIDYQYQAEKGHV